MALFSSLKFIKIIERNNISNHKEDFYCLNCFHSYRTENKLEAQKKYVKTMIIAM